MQIGLFFGSFNPVHVGHLIIADYMANHTTLDQVWLVVSPQNPFKKKESLANDYTRLNLTKIAVGDNPRLRVSDVEFKLPQPSYTIDTLSYLSEQYPQHKFSLIVGGDNLATLPKWKNYEVILRDYHLYVFPRLRYELGDLANHPSVTLMPNTPVMDISATFIRETLRSGKSIRYLVTDKVLDEINASNLYR